MTYDSSFWAIEGEVIPEVANFEEECLATSVGWEWEKEILKICWFMQAIEPRSLEWNFRLLTTTLSYQSLVLEEGDFYKLS